ncbi:MAG TPA: phospholipase D-like domain-containing protein [Anaeromyxobacter sp.]|nr:phospholipase D-like domain-containing protein [Anaeromyxobacter sp.]
MRPNARPAAALLLLALLAGGCRSRTGAEPAPAPAAGATAAPAPPLSGRLEAATGATLVDGNELTPIENGAVFGAMVKDIAAARRHVHVVSYIWRGERGPSRRIADALLRRAKGVACRVVVDPLGSLKFDRAQRRELERSGCEIRSYGLREDLRPTARNHRKIVVVDGVVGITGGWGFHTSWEGDGRSRDEWRDSSVRARGPVVAQMQRAFEQSWRESGGAPLPPGAYPGPEAAKPGGTRAAFVASSPRGDRPSAAEAMTHLLVAAARRRLWIANSYFVPDDALQDLIAERARRGVDVRVLAPGPVHDVAPVRAGQRATYERLLAAGVRIYEYQPSMMHAKTILVDDRWVAVGSTNMDPLSFDRLEEGSLVADSAALARHLERRLRLDFSRSDEITREEWSRRGRVAEVGRDTADFFSEWL